MEINYKSKKLEKTVADLSTIKKHYGTMAKAVNIRLNELKHADNLSEIRFLPQANCHELSQNRKGQLSVVVSGNHRIIFEPANEPIPTLEQGGLDWSKVTMITILEIAIDYH